MRVSHRPIQTRRRNHRTDRGLEPNSTESSSEEEFGLWTAEQPLYPITTLPVREPMLRERCEENAVPVLQPRVEAPQGPEAGPADQGEAPASSSESEEEQREAVVAPQRPVRTRRPPRFFTYDQLGEPSQTCPIRAGGSRWVPC